MNKPEKNIKIEDVVRVNIEAVLCGFIQSNFIKYQAINRIMDKIRPWIMKDTPPSEPTEPNLSEMIAELKKPIPVENWSKQPKYALLDLIEKIDAEIQRLDRRG